MQKVIKKRLIGWLVLVTFAVLWTRFVYLYAKIESGMVVLLSLVNAFEEEGSSTTIQSTFVSNFTILKHRREALGGNLAFWVAMQTNSLRAKAFSARIEDPYFKGDGL